jgi:hypothetical protein
MTSSSSLLTPTAALRYLRENDGYILITHHREGVVIYTAEPGGRKVPGAVVRVMRRQRMIEPSSDGLLPDSAQSLRLTAEWS